MAEKTTIDESTYISVYGSLKSWEPTVTDPLAASASGMKEPRFSTTPSAQCSIAHDMMGFEARLNLISM